MLTLKRNGISKILSNIYMLSNNHVISPLCRQLGRREFTLDNENNTTYTNINNNNNNGDKLKIKIKIKSKVPYIMLPDNKKIYLEKSVPKPKNPLDEQNLISSFSSIASSNINYIPPTSASTIPPEIDMSMYSTNTLDESFTFDNSGVDDMKYDIKEHIEPVKTLPKRVTNKKQVKKKSKIFSKDTDLETSDEGDLPVLDEDSLQNKLNSKNRTIIVDGTLVIYKSYMSTLKTPIGSSKFNGLYGFTRSLIKIIQELKPDNIVVCFDHSKKSTYRNQIYPEYKSTRSPTPQDLIDQFPLIPECTESLGIKFASQAGHECDDIIATYAKISMENGDHVIIVTDDKDLFQLVKPNITVYSLKDNKIFDEKDVTEKYGIPPSAFVTYQSLVGDKVDNIPGANGIGPKYSTDLIKAHGNLEGIFENLDKIPPKFSKILFDSKQVIEMSYQLAKLNEEVPLEVPYEDLKFNPIDKSKFISFLEKFRFKSIVDSLPKSKLKFQKSEIELEEEEEVVFSNNNNLFEKEEPILENEFNEFIPKGVTPVRDVETAKRVVQLLRKETNAFHACDTEVIDIDLKTESPIGHGKVICFSIYCGKEYDFGKGPIVWVDCMDDIEGAEILKVFKDYFEDESILKVWHNYAFDRHVLGNHGINVKGFGGDTLQMARLWDASRASRGGYSLEALSKELLNEQKVSIKDLFGIRKIKIDGEEGKAIIIPPLDHLQRTRKYLHSWIQYSSRDALVTWDLRENLHLKLKDMQWTNPQNSMWDFYFQNYRPFGHLLTEMERRGMKIDIEYLKSIQVSAEADIQENRKKFWEWAIKHSPGAVDMNIDSDAQIQQLLFAPVTNSKTKEQLPQEKEFDCLNSEGIIEPGKKKAKKMRQFLLKGLGMPFTSTTKSGWPSVDSASLRELCGSNPEQGKYGTAYDFFMGMTKEIPNEEERKQVARETCLAINSILEVGSIGTLLNTFIIPLQSLADSNSRLHTSVNVNTETGRLSSRRPNLQNQPALEKDRYKIRKAFNCEPGNTLIVADYGQLELRLLAHITNCKSMIEAFKIGGDFHSRTAMGMYPHVKQAIDRGEVLLEYDGEGEPPKPLLKNVYASERRKAKTLNFSIAYGKTAHGLSQDWSVSLKEAKETLNRWYEDRPEVLVWQRKTIETAHKHKWTRTLMGRYRPLPDIDNNTKGMKNHAERAAINTPLQGGAADIAMKAMLLIEDNARLKELGFQLIMQIHDELILEGPEENAEEARKIVMSQMSNPFSNSNLLIDLIVDCRFAKTWYEAK